MFWSLLVCAAISIVGILLVSDANLSLYLASPLPVDAFKNQVVWVVGASSGIGAKLSEDFCSHSAHVILSARRVGRLEELAKSCVLLGAASVQVLPLDVTDFAAHEPAFEQILSRHGHLDMVVLNAGVDQANTAQETEVETTRYLMNLNFLSYVSLTKTVLPHLTGRKSGQVRFQSF
jgi:NADP-dependent 3-hydroxy acid dehydrogenase YdfG